MKNLYDKLAFGLLFLCFLLKRKKKKKKTPVKHFIYEQTFAVDWCDRFYLISRIPLR